MLLLVWLLLFLHAFRLRIRDEHLLLHSIFIRYHPEQKQSLHISRSGTNTRLLSMSFMPMSLLGLLLYETQWNGIPLAKTPAELSMRQQNFRNLRYLFLTAEQNHVCCSFSRDTFIVKKGQNQLKWEFRYGGEDYLSHIVVVLRSKFPPWQPQRAVE